MIKHWIHTINYHFIRKIRNIIRWLPVLWKDGDWDSYYIYTVLETKIDQIRQYIQKNKRYVGWENDVKWMNTCIRLIQRIKDEYYENEPFDYYDSEFIWTDSNEHPGCQELTGQNTTRDQLNEYFKKNERLYQFVLIQSTIDSSRIPLSYRMARLKHEKAKKLLYRILNDHMEKWWD